MMGSKADEAGRLEALRRYEILDTAVEENFDRFTRIVSTILNTPISLISLVDSDRQWFKSKIGLDAAETPRDVAFCDHAIRGDDVMVVEDAAEDARFASNPLVIGDPFIRFYAGAPLVTSDGYRIGTLCAIDKRPHTFSAKERQLLSDFSHLVMQELELRALNKKAKEDLTALIKSQDEIERQKETLALQAQELAVLAKANHDARLVAEGALQQKSLFIAAMAHELRTPLSAIIGFSELMKSAAFGPLGNARYGEFSADIHSSGQHLLSLINDLLDLSKIEAGKFEVVPEAVDLNQSVGSILRSVGGLAKEKAIELNCRMLPEPRLVLADPRAVKQMMINLLSNAIKFTPVQGMVYVAIEAAGADCRISVSDTGQGIAAADMARILKPYEQVRRNGSSDAQGTGLGLAIVNELVRLHDRTLTLDSTIGVGTTASFSLPFAS